MGVGIGSAALEGATVQREKIGPGQFKTSIHKSHVDPNNLTPFDRFTEDGYLIDDLRPETLDKYNQWVKDTGQESRLGLRHTMKPGFKSEWLQGGIPDNWIANTTAEAFPDTVSYNPNKVTKPGTDAGSRTSETAGGKRRRAATRGLALLTSTGNNGSTTGR